MAELQGLPGFRDFYPEDLAVRSHIFAVWRDVARRFGFEEYDGPPLEPLEIYTRKSGEEIVRQLYDFEDKGGRHVALRPEMTPTLVRMLGARARSLPKPVRWFSIPQLFRYERQQRGRLREHFQLNLDIIGEAEVLADAELLAAGIEILRELGLDSRRVRARVSDRRLLRALFVHEGVPEEKVASVYPIIDRLDREPKDRLGEQLESVGLGHDVVERIFEITTLRGIHGLRSEFEDVEPLTDTLEELARYLEHLDDLGVPVFVEVDLSVVRGLAYYTGIVFEIWDARRELRAICGGGRYDELFQLLGGVDLPALGFGMGDVVLAELLSEHGLLPDYGPALDCFIVAIGDESRRQALRTAQRLRKAGFSVAYEFRARAVARQFKSADQAGARRAVVIGPEELERGEARIRDMRSGSERSVTLEDVPKGIQEVESDA